MHKILQKILVERKKDIQTRKNTIFSKTLLSAKGIAIIGELKFASPTDHSIGSKKLLVRKIKEYEDAGISALSIVTEPHFFQGDIGYIAKAKKVSDLPILQKDFIIDEKQIYEAAFLGVDALLLIARILKSRELKEYVSLCKKLGIEPIVEVAREEDIQSAITSGTDIIAINARDLDTFTVNIRKACELLKMIPDSFIKLGFSGVKTQEDMDMYNKAGVQGVLIGISLMKTENVSDFLRSFHYEKN